MEVVKSDDGIMSEVALDKVGGTFIITCRKDKLEKGIVLEKVEKNDISRAMII